MEEAPLDTLILEMLLLRNSFELIGKSFEDSVNLASFQLEYDRIASIDITNTDRIVLNAYGSVYTIFVSNPHEIMEAVNNKLTQVKSAKQAGSEE